jgi:hypothetical protein
MLQALLFILAVVGILSLVPLLTLAATGSWRQAVRAGKAYLFCMGLMLAIALVLVAAGLIGSVPQ